MSALGREFPEAKKYRIQLNALQKFNSENPNGIKRKLKLQFKGSKEHDLQRKTSGGKSLSDLKVIRRKEASVTKPSPPRQKN